MVARSKPNEIHITRVYDAPVELVWEAWTDPEQVAKWWGPRGCTLTTHSKDLRPGGIWHYTMHGPDGTDYPNKTLYHEVEEKSKLVYDHGGYDDRPPLFRVTVLFISEGDKTRMEMTMAFPTAEEAAASKKFIKEVGGNSTWDRLGEYLEKVSTGNEQFVINRSFEAPRELVFDLWINPEHVAKWLPPAGFEMEYLRADIKRGGTTFFKVTNNADVTLYARAEYLQIDRPDLIVYTQQFVDEHEQPGKHPHLDVWPPTLLTTVQFAAERENETRVTVTWVPIGEYTPAELQAFVDLRSSMAMGWTGSFDKLEDLLGAMTAAG
ncbi:MAG: hypothetical protein CMJ46_02215 [Planctomyces sp.]|nr:hypothetical protein [Planctomyces sp.]